MLLPNIWSVPTMLCTLLLGWVIVFVVCRNLPDLCYVLCLLTYHILHCILLWSRRIQSTPSHFTFKESFNFIILSTSRDVFPSYFLSKILYAFLLLPCMLNSLSYPPWCDHYNNVWWRVQIMKLHIVWVSQPSVISSLFCPDHLSIQLRNTLGLPLMWGTKFHTHTELQVKVRLCILYSLQKSYLHLEKEML